jgi:hypothetical protein
MLGALGTGRRVRCIVPPQPPVEVVGEPPQAGFVGITGYLELDGTCGSLDTGKPGAPVITG